MKLRILKKKDKVLAKSIRLWTYQKNCNYRKLIKDFIKYDNSLKK